MIQGNNIGEPVFKLFVNASTDYVNKIEGLAVAVKHDEPLLSQLLNVLANSTAQSVNLIVKFWPSNNEKDTAGDVQRSA